MTTTLKRLMGEAGAGLDRSMGGSNGLSDVLNALCQPKVFLFGSQVNVAAASIARCHVPTATKLRTMKLRVAVCGTANTTTVQCQVNGTSCGEISIANDATDPTVSSVTLDKEVAAGDLVEIIATAAATSATGLTATVSASPVDIE